ncbi:hypothetical protein [Sphingobium sp.]|uniref:hypothetical protein n=1 Tax=Sphingobium sp. TaxID=1912891 RepID=UPI002E1CC90F
MTIISTSSLDLNTARSRITSQQIGFKNARGSRALAQMIVEGFILIKDIIDNLNAEEQLGIFDEHGLTYVENASTYGQWIKVIFGEPHPDPQQTFTDCNGVEQRIWVPDRSMEVYHHTMEDLAHFGVTANHVDFILDKGGALAMATTRKKRLAQAENSGAEAVALTKRTLFLAETIPSRVTTSLAMPKDAAEFVTVACRVVDGGLELLGVINKDATAQVNRLAADRYEDLLKARDERERMARMKDEAEKRVEERMASLFNGMNKEQRLAYLAELAARAGAKAQTPTSTTSAQG